jgi:putative aldouronate transport system permease protein
MKVGRSAGDIAIDVTNTIGLVLITFVTVYPILYVISMSISSVGAVLGNRVILWPIGFDLSSYKTLFGYSAFWHSYLNTLWYAGVGTLLNLVVTVLGGYALSRRELYGRNVIMIYVLITMLFSGGLVPSFLLVKWLGLYNTRWAVVLPAASNVWYLMIVRVYMQGNIPDSLIDAARIDGYNDLRIVMSVVIPLSGTIIAIIGLFAAVAFWNSYFSALIFLSDQKLKPLQLILMEMLVQMSDVPVGGEAVNLAKRMQFLMQLRYVAIVASIVPIMCVYPFIQKYFVKGVLIGAIKE